MNPLDQLISVRFKSELSASGTSKLFSFKPRNQADYSCAHPLKMFCTMIKFMNAKRQRISQPFMTSNEMAQLAEEMINSFKIAHFVAECKNVKIIKNNAQILV
jgi:hypothetical protein